MYAGPQAEALGSLCWGMWWIIRSIFMGFCKKYMLFEGRFVVHFENVVLVWSDTLGISMRNEKAHCPSCFAPRGWTVETQGGDFKVLIIWYPTIVSWGKHLLSAFENFSDYSTFGYRLSVCSLQKHFQLFKSSEILAGPNSWLWVVLVKSLKLYTCCLSLDWLVFQ